MHTGHIHVLISFQTITTAFIDEVGKRNWDGLRPLPMESAMPAPTGLSLLLHSLAAQV